MTHDLVVGLTIDLKRHAKSGRERERAEKRHKQHEAGHVDDE